VRARRDLLELVRSSARPPAQAILELSRRESENPATRAIAKRELEKLVRREPRNWDALWELVRLLSEDGENEVALARIAHASSRNNNKLPPRVLMLRAQIRANAGIEEGTLEDARTAFTTQPRLRGALELLVGLHLRRGEVAEALAAAETARDAQALNPERRLLLARLYRMNGKDAEAVSTLENALETDGENPSVYFHMGMALRALDREPEATRALEKALAISSSFPEADHARRALQEGRGEG
jgi:tetratricopeptide (TPR) repeat protein